MVRYLPKGFAHVSRSYWVSSGFYSGLSKCSTVVFGFVNFFLLIRLLSWADYGAWILFMSVCTIMELIKHGFIRNPLIRFLAISPASRWPGLQSASFTLNVLLCLVQLLLLAGGAFYLPLFWNVPQLESLFIIYLNTTVVLIMANHLEVVQQANMKFKELFLSGLVRHGGPFLFICLISIFNVSITLDQLAASQGISVLLSCILAYFLNPGLCRFSERVEWRTVRDLFQYGKYTFGTNVSSMIVKNTDTWILGRMISVEAVTLFNPAIRMSNLVEVPTDTLSFVYFPRVSREARDGGSERVKYFYERAVAAILAIMIPVVFTVVAFADNIIYFIAGPGFGQAGFILKITMLYGLILPFNRFFGVTLDAIGKADTNFRTVLLTASINAVSNLVFIRIFGITGAAYGTLLTYVIMLAVNQVYLHRHFGISFLGILRQVFLLYKNPLAIIPTKRQSI